VVTILLAVAVTTAVTVPIPVVPVTVPVAISAAAVRVTGTTVSHVFSWSGCMRAVCNGIVDTDAATIEFDAIQDFDAF
jgi:hypothetical protein